MPARSHPINLHLEEKLNRLKGCKALPSTSYSPSMEMLPSLRDLYQSMEILLRSQRSHQALAHDFNSLEQELDGSLRLLDAISATRDDMLQMTELISDIQSAIRRRWVSKSELEKRLGVYKSFRKKIKKEIEKRVRDLRRNEVKSYCHKSSTFSSSIHDNKEMVISVVRVARLITISFFESLTSFTIISRPVTRSKWSLVSKYWKGTALVTSEEAADQRMSETARVEASLNALICRQKTGKEDEDIRADDVQKQLETLERSIRVIEEELEGMFRRLIWIRVSLLNSLSC